ncbi:glutamate-cysteine ligase family protein [Streptomyces sp. M19]
MTVGVEEEYLLLDDESGYPVPRGEQVRTAAGMTPAVVAAEVESELLQAQVEVSTPVCGGLDEVGGHLRRLRRAVSTAAADCGCRVAACGAAPLLRPVPVTDQPRYQAMFKAAPRLVDEQLINGMHVHVAVPDRESAVAALNRLRRWLPALVALSANSPSGTAPRRVRQLADGGVRPVAGERPPPAFTDAADYRRRTRTCSTPG